MFITVYILYAPCIVWQQYGVVKIVREANKQMNRRELDEGNCKLHHDSKNVTEYL